MNITDFINVIPDFLKKTSSEQIDFIVYYLLVIKKQEGVKAKDVELVFKDLYIPAYSNIGAYLNKFAKKGKNQKFIKEASNFLIERSRKEEIDIIANNKPLPKPTNSLYPQILLNNTRGYLSKIGEQASICYDIGLYDACLVMLRKLVETLIIECFERTGLNQKLKEETDTIFF